MVQSIPLGDKSPEYWRAHGEEARAMASEMTDPEGRVMLVQIATLYDDMALRAERAARYRSITGQSGQDTSHAARVSQKPASTRPAPPGSLGPGC